MEMMVVRNKIVRERLEKQVVIERKFELLLKIFHGFGNRFCERDGRRDNKALGVDVELGKNDWVAIL